MLQKGIYFTYQKEKEKLKKSSKKDYFSSFFYKDINSISGNFIFLPKLEIE
jgi:hypothetical protein